MEFILVMEIIGTIAFAVSGALVAIEKSFDYYGIVILATITAVGGGIVRDVIINRNIPVAMEDPIYVIISIATAFAVILLYKRVVMQTRILLVSDAIGLAAFTAIGVETALAESVYTPFVAITLAVLTGTGGGIIRDICAKEIPFVFKKEIYSIASIIGSIAFMVTLHYSANKEIAMYLCFGCTLAIRVLALIRKWKLPKVRN